MDDSCTQMLSLGYDLSKVACFFYLAVNMLNCQLQVNEVNNSPSPTL